MTAKTRLDMTDWTFRCDLNYEQQAIARPQPASRYRQDAWKSDWQSLNGAGARMVSRRPLHNSHLEATISIAVIILIIAIVVAFSILFGTLHFPGTATP